MADGEHIKEAFKDAEYRKNALINGLDEIICGDFEEGKKLLRRYITSCMTYSQVSLLTGIPINSVMRMVSENGSPTLRNFIRIYRVLLIREGINVAMTYIDENQGWQ